MGALSKRVKYLRNQLEILKQIFNMFQASDELKLQLNDTIERIDHIPALANKNPNLLKAEIDSILFESEKLLSEVNPQLWSEYKRQLKTLQED